MYQCLETLELSIILKSPLPQYDRNLDFHKYIVLNVYHPQANIILLNLIVFCSSSLEVFGIITPDRLGINL